MSFLLKVLLFSVIFCVLKGEFCALCFLWWERLKVHAGSELTVQVHDIYCMHMVVKSCVYTPSRCPPDRSVSSNFPTLNENALDVHVCRLVRRSQDGWSFKAMNRSFQRWGLLQREPGGGGGINVPPFPPVRVPDLLLYGKRDANQVKKGKSRDKTRKCVVGFKTKAQMFSWIRRSLSRAALTLMKAFEVPMDVMYHVQCSACCAICFHPSGVLE